MQSAQSDKDDERVREKEKFLWKTEEICERQESIDQRVAGSMVTHGHDHRNYHERREQDFLLLRSTGKPQEDAEHGDRANVITDKKRNFREKERRDSVDEFWVDLFIE